MDLLQQAKRDCLARAAYLQKYGYTYETMPINMMADYYCEALDMVDCYRKRVMVNSFSAALILRFWYTIEKTYQKCKTAGIDRLEVFNNLYECINVACKYRAWQDPSNHTNAQACINKAIATRGVAAFMYRSNLQKNKVRATQVSCDDYLDEEHTLLDIYTAESDTNYNSRTLISDIMADLIHEGKITHAIIINAMVTEDVYKQTDEGEEFAPLKLVKVLNRMGQAEKKFFLENYTVNEKLYDIAISGLQNQKNAIKYKQINQVRLDLQERLTQIM